MWAAEAITAKEISFGDNSYETWDNAALVNFIKRKRREHCSEFDRALEWLGDRNYQQAMNDCPYPHWRQWLRDNLPDYWFIPKGMEVTITKGVKYEYCIWARMLVDTPAEYIEKITRIIANE